MTPQDAEGRDRERLFQPVQGRLFGETMDGEPTAPYAACYDCGRTYGDAYGFPDLVVPNDVWQLISPTGDEGGLLCPSCIVRRCAQEGVECEARWRSGPFAEYNRLAAADPEGECETERMHRGFLQRLAARIREALQNTGTQEPARE